jgi:ribonuclease P protein component
VQKLLVAERLPLAAAKKAVKKSLLLSNMLPKKHRITTELFQTIMKEGSFASGSVFSFRYISQKVPQYAFVAPKKPFKTAVLRNKLRRQGYSALKKYPLKSAAGIFFYKKLTKQALFSEIVKDIGLLLQKMPK